MPVKIFSFTHQSLPTKQLSNQRVQNRLVIAMGILCLVGASRVPVLASIHALHLVRILVKLAPGWLCNQRAIVDQLIEMWRSQKRLDRLAREEELSQIEVLESKVIAKCLLNFINAKHEEVSPLLEIVSIFVVSCLLLACVPVYKYMYPSGPWKKIWFVSVRIVNPVCALHEA